MIVGALFMECQATVNLPALDQLELNRLRAAAVELRYRSQEAAAERDKWMAKHTRRSLPWSWFGIAAAFLAVATILWMVAFAK